MADSNSKPALRNTWESAAPGWAKWERVLAKSLSAATDTLIDMAAVRPGARVLDLACGAGSQSIQAAKRVGPNGKVVACDISGTMLEFVRQNAAHAGVQNIDTLECAADDLDDTQRPFDASICRMALMLFPSPPSALAAVRRVLKPGARFAAMVFTTPANNPFMAQPMGILLRHAGKPPPTPGQPGIFALGADGLLEERMREGGFDDVKTKIVRAPLVLASASDAVQLLQEAAGAYRAVVADLDEAGRAKAWGEVQAALKQFEANGGFRAELEFVIASGAKPN